MGQIPLYISWHQAVCLWECWFSTEIQEFGSRAVEVSWTTEVLFTQACYKKRCQQASLAHHIVICGWGGRGTFFDFIRIRPLPTVKTYYIFRQLLLFLENLLYLCGKPTAAQGLQDHCTGLARSLHGARNITAQDLQYHNTGPAISLRRACHIIAQGQ